MMRRDDLGWLCDDHGRVSLGNDDTAQLAAARHLERHHPDVWARARAAELEATHTIRGGSNAARDDAQRHGQCDDEEDGR